MNKQNITWKLLILSITALLLLPPITLGCVDSYNDDDTPEVTIDEIISPPLYGKTGNYSVTAQFTTIGITINGTRDFNEPWIEHTESPDNNPEPYTNFHTSCDEDYMYVAFESTSRKITHIEIFVDKNNNNIWDGTPIDSLFIITSIGYTPTLVKDHNENPIPNSQVAWGNHRFIEIKIPKVNWSSCQQWAYKVNSYSLDHCNPLYTNPSWDDTTYPFPPCGEFLNSTCNYDFTCPCGVAFKAYTDIFKINIGDCDTIYETDFENQSKVASEWQANSLDSNSDTWNISQTKSKSPTYSFHCTNNTNYYGNTLDVLEMRNPIDLSNTINVSLSFWHWCKGDTYTSNTYTSIVDYGDIEIYAFFHEEWVWISLSDLGISNLYYDNDWTQSTIKIEKSNFYPLDGENISGEQLLTNNAKFRFVWKSSPQFQYEGWYIDDIEVKACKNEWYDPLTPVWQGWEIICMPLGSTQIYSFPLKWNANEEGKYLVKVCFQEERPWHSPVDAPCLEKIVTIGDIHDIAVTSLISLDTIDKDETLNITTTIKNVGTYDETNVQVKATIKNEDGTAVWQETTTIPTLNVSDEVHLNFAWEHTTYCNHILEVRAILPSDEIPLNNSMSKPVVVATTIFSDSMNDDCSWIHSDLTGGVGHWNICTSGYNNYLWCGLQETTQYDNNWNDVATINRSFDLSQSTSPFLTFNSSHRMNQSDYGYVEISPDNGRHWHIISTFTSQSDWQVYTYDLFPYNTDETKIRFRFFSNETITNRGWVLDNITITNQTHTFFDDNFESGTANWTIERQRTGDWWQRVTKPAPSNTNNKAWWCGDETTGTYLSNLNNALTLSGPCAETIDLSKAFDASILFLSWHNISKGDIGYIEARTPRGVWNIIGSITNNSNGWSSHVYSIKDYVGGEVSIRFRFTSDNSEESEGWYIDNVKVVAKLDTTPPVTTCTLSGTTGNDNWYTSSTQITLSATDDYTGVKDTYYKLDTNPSLIYISPLTVPDGTHTIEYWSEDNIGNLETPHGSTSFKVDSTNPTINITNPDAGIYWRDHKIWPLIKLSLFKWSTPLIIRHITIAATADDSTSGISHVEFHIDSTLKSTDTSAPFEWLWDETVFFKHTITTTAYDNAGNSATATKTVKIFNTNFFGK